MVKSFNRISLSYLFALYQVGDTGVLDPSNIPCPDGEEEVECESPSDVDEGKSAKGGKNCDDTPIGTTTKTPKTKSPKSTTVISTTTSTITSSSTFTTSSSSFSSSTSSSVSSSSVSSSTTSTSVTTKSKKRPKSPKSPTESPVAKHPKINSPKSFKTPSNADSPTTLTKQKKAKEYVNPNPTTSDGNVRLSDELTGASSQGASPYLLHCTRAMSAVIAAT